MYKNVETEEEMNELLSSMSCNEALNHLILLAHSHKNLESFIPDHDTFARIRASIDYDCGVKAIRVVQALFLKLRNEFGADGMVQE